MTAGSRMRVTTRLNGAIVPDAQTADMIFDVAPMKPGDVCECSIERVGSLRNPIAREWPSSA